MRIRSLLGMSFVLLTTDVWAGSGVIVEGVSTFTTCNGDPIPGAVPDITGFQNEITMTSPWHGGFTYSGFLSNTGVWTTDFHDPNKSGFGPDSDHIYFDKPGLAFSYFAGHGVDSWGDTCWAPGCFNYFQPCSNASSDCNSPIPYSTFPSVCRRHPGDSTGFCSYTSMNRTGVIDCVHNDFGREGTFMISGPFVRFGEGPGVGWAGAGTGGGTNVVVLSMSYPHMSGRPQELFPAFAGVQLILSPLVHWGDAYVPSNRGYWFAKQAENPNASVANAFLAGMAGIGNPNSPNSWCLNSAGTAIYGGGYGVNGCGGAVALTTDISAGWAQSNLARSFVNIQNDAFKSAGNGYWAAVAACNFDCNTWTMAL